MAPGARILPRAALALSVLVYAAATTGMALRVEPFYTWFFLFAWWPFILAAESLLVLMGGFSELYERPWRFAALAAFSVVFWLFFEALNFRLGNWFYIGVPEAAPLRWAGYILSFATVLPGLSVVRRLLEFTGLFEEARCRPWRRVHDYHGVMLAAGVVMLVLPMLWPRYFFPLVWGAVVLLLEPWLQRRGGRSLLRDLFLGRPRNVWLLLAAGFVCGGLWECWNYWAGSKWVYQVPFVGDVKLFEMPVLGFFGFPPFALECYAAASAFDLVGERLAAMPAAPRRAVLALLCVAAAAFAALVMLGIDRYTVASFG